MSHVYYQGETVRQKAEVKNVSGMYIAPDTITITIKDPAGTLVATDEAMSEEDVGKYYYDYSILDEAEQGEWKTEVKAVKGYKAVEQDEFRVVARLVA